MNKQNFCIIASEKDEAGKNIFKQVHENFPMLNHYLIKQDSIFAENLDKQETFKDYGFFIFATKHQSREERKTLSIHVPGNFDKAEFGGKQGEICMTSAFFLKHIFQILNKEVKNKKSDYETTLEVTHHGPYLDKPCCFIEIGTTIKEWKDEKAGRIIAGTIKKAIKSFNPAQNWIHAIAIGSPHYCPNFNKIQLNSNYALSHIIPNYVSINKEMIIKAIQRTEEKVEVAILDWKGMKGEDRQKIVKILEELGIKVLRTSDVEK